MPGGLLQLVGVGAQNELVNGNPSMTHFRAVYRRHTNFAMEHIRMTFTSSSLEFSTTSTKTISCRIDRYAQLIHDTYLVMTLPDIWSPLKSVGAALPTGYGAGANIVANAIGYEFQWIDNLGYNMIDHVDLVMNGTVIQSLRGEWLKFYSYLTHDKNKRLIVDQMVGNVPELTDPANAYDRRGQYPHAVTPVVTPSSSPQTTVPEPSIRSRQLVIPLHFWFCENPGLALPLVSLQNAEVYINVTLRSLNDLYTVVDVNPASTTYGQRVRPVNYPMVNFLSPPLSTGAPSSPTLTTFFPDPYLEGNFIYLTEMEMNQLARADQTFLIKTVKFINHEGQYGGNSDIELPMFNLTTRVVFSTQRSDKIATNDWDNYTNWQDRNRAPWAAISNDIQTAMYSSGQQQVTSVYPRDPMVNALILFDGKERFATKPLPFFSLLQMYRHSTGDTPDMPGVYMYSFALDNNGYQPSGAANGSMFNKIVLRLTLQQPLPLSLPGATSTVVNVLKSTVFSPNPTIITAAQCAQLKPDGTHLYPPDQIVTVVQTNDNVIFTYTYNLGVYVESINFLRIVSGLANLVFAS
jgi:hypothetical protein